jgi:membrane-anchored protein YejM (alkaline phosphatase superfamily)
LARPSGAGEPPILVLVSFDGWRWDYIDRLPAPNLKAFAPAASAPQR